MEEIDLKDLFNLFWEKKWVFIFIVIIAIALGVVYTMFFVTPTYTSSTTLILVSSSDSGTSNTITSSDLTLNSNLVSTYGQIVKSDSVLSQVIANLDLTDIDEDELRENIDVTEVDDAEVIEISVTNESAIYAYKIANEIANVFIEKTQELYNLENVRVLDEAKKLDSPSNINHTKDVVIFAAIGIIVGIAYVFILNLFDTTIKTEDEIEKEYNIHVLASIPAIENFDALQKGGKRK